MIEASAIGSSSSAVTSGTRSKSMCGSRTSSWWLVLRRSATRRAHPDSSNERSEKPIEKLFTFPGVSSAMVAATALESMPPDRKTPIGTSDTSSFRTASFRAARRSAAQASRSGSGACSLTSRSTFHHWRTATDPSSCRQRRTCPGGSFSTPRRIDRGDVTYSSDRYCPTAATSISRGTPGWASIALSSEPKTKSRPRRA